MGHGGRGRLLLTLLLLSVGATQASSRASSSPELKALSCEGAGGFCKELQSICENPPYESGLGSSYQCAAGGRAVPKLAHLAQSSALKVAQAMELVLHELPPALRAQTVSACRGTQGDGPYLDCLEQVVASTEPPPQKEFNKPAALRAITSLKSNQTIFENLSIACLLASGGKVSSKADGAMQLNLSAVPKTKQDLCAPKPPFVNAEKVAFSPSPKVSKAAPLTLDEDPLFYKFGQGGMGIAFRCPEYLPREFCGGGRYDPREYRLADEKFLTDKIARAKTEAERNELILKRGSLALTPPQYEFRPGDGPSAMLGNADLTAIAATLQPDFEGEVQDFLTNIYAENFVQGVLLTLPRDQWEQAFQELTQASQCSKSSREASSRAIGLAGEIQKNNPGNTLEYARTQYLKEMALGAQCMTAVQSRWNELRQKLGQDLTLAAPLLGDEELKSLPTAARYLATTGLYLFPAAKLLLHDSQFLHLEEVSKRECGVLQSFADPQKNHYCSNVYKEFLLLTQEMQDLATSYPQLLNAEGNAGKPGYRRIADFAKQPIDPRIQHYNLDLNSDSIAHLQDPSGVGLNSCMSTFRKDPKARDSDLSEPATKWLEAARVPTRVTGTTALLHELEGQISALCDSGQRHEIVKAVIRSPQVMDAYFRCDRARFLKLAKYRVAAVPAQVKLDDKSECPDRKNSAWIACHLNREDQSEQLRAEAISNSLQALGDGLGWALPFSGFSLSGLNMLKGAAAGAFIGAVLAPSQQSIVNPLELDIALGNVGLASWERVEAARARLEDVRRRNPEWFDAAIIGGLTGGIAGAFGHPPDRVGKAVAQMERDLILTYERLRGAGRVGTPEFTALESEISKLLDEAIHKKYPDLPKPILDKLARELTMDQKIALSRGKPLPLIDTHLKVSDAKGNPGEKALALKPGDEIEIPGSDSKPPLRYRLKSLSDTGGDVWFEWIEVGENHPGGGGKVISEPLDEFNARVGIKPFKAFSRDRPLVFSGPPDTVMGNKVIQARLQKMGVKIIQGPEADRLATAYSLEHGGQAAPEAWFDPTQKRIVLLPQATAEAFLHEYRHFLQWSEANAGYAAEATRLLRPGDLDLQANFARPLREIDAGNRSRVWLQRENLTTEAAGIGERIKEFYDLAQKTLEDFEKHSPKDPRIPKLKESLAEAKAQITQFDTYMQRMSAAVAQEFADAQVGALGARAPPMRAGLFDESFSSPPGSFAAEQPLAYKTFAEVQDRFSLDAIIKKTKSEPGKPVLLNDVLETGLEERIQAAKELRAALPVDHPLRPLLESSLANIDKPSKLKAVRNKLALTPGAPLDLGSLAHREALALVTVDARSVVGEMRAAMSVPDLRLAGAKTGQFVDSLLKSVPKDAAGKALRQEFLKLGQSLAKDTVTIDGHNIALAQKELDLVWGKDIKALNLGEVKTFEKPLALGTQNWTETVVQAKKTQQVAERVAAVTKGRVDKSFFFMGGIEESAAAELLKQFPGWTIVGPIVK